MSTIIEQRLASYGTKTALEEQHAIKEITQEIALMALSKAKFFSVAEFHGGTALRILHGLQRFSEDLDFALLAPDPQFALKNYLSHMIEEFHTYGFEINISDRAEVNKTVQKQFLKIDSLGKLIQLQYPFNRATRQIKVKFEVDTNPPSGAITELKYLNFPLTFSLLAKDMASSFSGKLHALLCRPHDKGRDWYDFIWYITNKSQVNFTLLHSALYQQGPWQGQEIILDKNWLFEHLVQKVKSIQWKAIAQDVLPLLKPNEVSSLALWGEDFFLSLINQLKKNLMQN